MAGESWASRQFVDLQPLIQKKFEVAARQQEGCHGHRETLHQTGRVNYPEAAMVLSRSCEGLCTGPRPGAHLRPKFFLPAGLGRQLARSEERRVGKECRSRWSP